MPDFEEPTPKKPESGAEVYRPSQDRTGDKSVRKNTSASRRKKRSNSPPKRYSSVPKDESFADLILGFFRALFKPLKRSKKSRSANRKQSPSSNNSGASPVSKPRSASANSDNRPKDGRNSDSENRGRRRSRGGRGRGNQNSGKQGKRELHPAVEETPREKAELKGDAAPRYRRPSTQKVETTEQGGENRGNTEPRRKKSRSRKSSNRGEGNSGTQGGKNETTPDRKTLSAKQDRPLTTNNNTSEMPERYTRASLKDPRNSPKRRRSREFGDENS